MKLKNFRVLLVSANTYMEPLMPLGIASIATMLEDVGVEVKLFDTTFYKKNDLSNSQSARESSLQVQKTDYSEVGVQPLECDPVDDFKKMVNEFKPQLIGCSCVELTYMQVLDLLKSIESLDIPNIVGGCFATFSPEIVLSNEFIDMVCVGDGENLIVELVRRIYLNESLDNIPNLYYKKNSNIIKSTGIDLVDVKKLPIAKFDIFAPERIYRPMTGKFYRMMPIEISRGCPYKCTYCSAPFYQQKFKTKGRWLRFKSIKQILKEVDYYVTNYNANYFYFISETFLALPKDQRLEFYEGYSKYKIPFWFNTRPETVKRDDIQRLQDIGCHRISMGIESGNEEFRRTVLKRNYSNKTVLKAINYVQESKIQLSVNNMIGFPDETRDMIFDTIELNRQFSVDSHSISIFQPFKGTSLYDYSVEKGYFNPNNSCSESFSTSVLNMPSISKSEIEGLYRTFNLYISMEKEFWPKIKEAEQMNSHGDMAFSKLVNI